MMTAADLRPEQRAAAVVRALRPDSWKPTDRAFRHLVPHDRKWKEHFDAAGIARVDEAGRKACFHSFRKTFNTMLQRQGRELFEIMQLMRVSDRKLVIRRTAMAGCMSRVKRIGLGASGYCSRAHMGAHIKRTRQST